MKFLFVLLPLFYLGAFAQPIMKIDPKPVAAGKEFRRIVKQYSNDAMADSLWQEASGNYSGTDRHYHTLEHISNFYNQLTRVKKQVGDWESLVLAAVYHDVIYGSPDHRDEERSAELAALRLKAAGVPAEKLALIDQLILATKAHAASGINDINLFNDADMSIVGLDRDYYARYVQNVRKEYANSPGFDQGRKRVLNYFLKMPRIFKTDQFHQWYEESARANISWEISTLPSLTKHVILVSIDGFRPDFYRDSAWPAPNLQGMAKRGVAATGVDGIFPSVTYPSHTSIITGAYPAEHQIYYNRPLEAGKPTGLWNSETSLIRSQTIWSAFRAAGLRTASVSWPVSVGADIDYNIPEAFTLKAPLDRRGPTSEFATPKGLFEEVQAKATGQMEAIDLNINHHKMDENLGRIAVYLYLTYRPALLTLHLPGVDHAEHTEGREGELVRTAVANADDVIGSILEAISLSDMKDSTTLIVTGDHGFVTVTRSFAPNVLLSKAGLLDAEAVDGRTWKAFFQASGGSAFLHLKDSSDTKTVGQVRDLLNGQPDTIKAMYRIIESAELKASGADPHAVLALAAANGVSINEKSSGSLTGVTKGGTHGYYPNFPEIQTGFVAVGPDFGKGKMITGMKLVDIAPIVASLLKMPFKKPVNMPILSQMGY